MRKNYRKKYYKKNWFSRSFLDFTSEYKHGKILPGSFLKRLFLCFGGFTGNDFRNYGFAEKTIRNIVINYTPYCRMFRTRGNDKSPSCLILQNKFETLKFLHSKGIPASIPRYIITQGKVFDLDDNFNPLPNEAKLIRQGDYVIKPLDQRWGVGIVFISLQNDIAVSSCDSIKQALYGDYKSMLVEEKVKNHTKLAALSKTSLNTLRIITAKTRGGEIVSFFACVRFSCNEGRIDNWSSGGYAANIDIDTGIAQTAIKKEATEPNPVNEITKGYTIPFFHEAKIIVEKAHRELFDMKSVGWDVAITPSGPIIIEGNDDWDVSQPQYLMGKGVRDFLCKI
ncbi:MAG: hypothetical protein LBL82_01730 [Oscillospiraceae bacterium]|jgi:hypothetical protein|nr:hypothetical protein [Oscillospiraceae bacterium]